MGWRAAARARPRWTVPAIPARPRRPPPARSSPRGSRVACRALRPHCRPRGGGKAAIHRHGGGLTGSPLLRNGSRGGQVTTLQSELNTHGYGLSVDWIFGPKTESEVRSFQSSKGLTVDGIVGPQTAGALNSAGAPAPAPKAPEVAAPATGPLSGSPMLKRGSAGSQVTLLQGMLDAAGFRCSADGVFGPETAFPGECAALGCAAAPWRSSSERAVRGGA
ncbi:MAG: hypothetical protein ACI8PZ_004334 [Myxococcota bacterium]|jgi:hypothetical protein